MPLESRVVSKSYIFCRGIVELVVTDQIGWTGSDVYPCSQRESELAGVMAVSVRVPPDMLLKVSRGSCEVADTRGNTLFRCRAPQSIVDVAVVIDGGKLPYSLR